MPADSGRGNEEGSGAQARRLSEQLLWLWVAANLYLGSSFSVHRAVWDCMSADSAVSAGAARQRGGRIVVSGKGPQVAPGPLHLPAETFEELLLCGSTNRQQQGFRGMRVGVVVGDGGSRAAAPTGGVSLPSRLTRRCRRRRKRSAGSYRCPRVTLHSLGCGQLV
jgi:hypothetical protein